MKPSTNRKTRITQPTPARLFNMHVRYRQAVLKQERRDETQEDGGEGGRV